MTRKLIDDYNNQDNKIINGKSFLHMSSPKQIQHKANLFFFEDSEV